MSDYFYLTPKGFDLVEGWTTTEEGTLNSVLERKTMALRREQNLVLVGV